jgi:thiamine-phosphate pyrophosphorylase
MRAKELPTKRKDITTLLTANCKRITEGLRVLEEYTGNAEFNAIRYDMYEIEKDLCLTHLKPPLKHGIYMISDSPNIIKQGIEWGVSLIQLRKKEASKAEIYRLACEIAPLFQNTDIPFIINDHIDIAIDIDADGLHTGQDDIPIPIQRELFGPHKIIGRTTHSLEQGLCAEKDGADYVSVGPIWDTPSKPGRPGIGVEYLKNATSSLNIPFVAIGGINSETVSEILPYSPPFIGLIRDHQNIPKIQAMHSNAMATQL